MNYRALQLLICKESAYSQPTALHSRCTRQTQNVLYKDCGINDVGKRPVRRQHPSGWVKLIFNATHAVYEMVHVFVLDLGANQQLLYKVLNDKVCTTTYLHIYPIIAFILASSSHSSFDSDCTLRVHIKRHLQLVSVLDTVTSKPLWPHGAEVAIGSNRQLGLKMNPASSTLL